MEGSAQSGIPTTNPEKGVERTEQDGCRGAIRSENPEKGVERHENPETAPREGAVESRKGS